MALETSTTAAGPAPIVSGASAGREEVFAEHLRRHARDYFPECDGTAPDVVLGWRRVRPGSALYAFEMEVGRERRGILVKVMRAGPDGRPPTANPGNDRPSLMRGLEPKLKCRMEYAVLAALHDHVRGLDDPRFDAVRVYDALPMERALIMELLPHPSLRDLLALPWRRPDSGMPGPETLLRNAGAWLNMYHGLPRPRPLATRHTRRDHFIAFSIEVTRFLARTMGRPSFFERVAKRLEEAGRAFLPHALPVGLSHGDYAMRNVLAGPTGAVSVIDTDGRWCTSIYEDIGHFLTDLRCNAIQVFSGGRVLASRSRRYERAFLDGYFGPEVPTEAVRLYEIQACLYKWAAHAAHKRRTEKLAPRMIRAFRLGVTSSYFRKVIESRLRDLPE